MPIRFQCIFTRAITIILCIVFILLAGYFFKDKRVSTKLSPADSRNYNKDCIISIFDGHDLWHLFSAIFLCCIIQIVNFFP